MGRLHCQTDMLFLLGWIVFLFWDEERMTTKPFHEFCSKTTPEIPTEVPSHLAVSTDDHSSHAHCP